MYIYIYIYIYTRIFVRDSRALDSLPGLASSPRRLVSAFVIALSTFVAALVLLVSVVEQPPSYASQFERPPTVCFPRRARPRTDLHVFVTLDAAGFFPR